MKLKVIFTNTFYAFRFTSLSLNSELPRNPRHSHSPPPLFTEPILFIFRGIVLLFMAWDLELWSSSFDQVASDGVYSEQPEWQCSFYLGRERERIKLLNAAISTLKDDHADDDTEVQLLLDKPAETVHEIVEALQRDNFHDKHCQHLQMVIFNPMVNAVEPALEKDCGSVESNIVIKEEEKELCGTTENSGSSELLLELRGKSSNDPEKNEGKELCGTSEKSRSSELILELHGKSSNDPEKKEGKELCGTSEKSRSSELLLELHVKSSNDPEKKEGRELRVTSEKSRSSELLLELKGKSSNDPEKKEGTELHGTSENSRRSELLLELHGKRSNDPGKIHVEKSPLLQELLAKSLVTTPDFGAISCAPDHSNVMKLSGTSDNKVTENEVRSQLIASGIKGRKRYPSSRVSASQHRGSESYDLDKKLCDLARKSAPRAYGKKGSKVAPAEDSDFMKLPPLQVVYPQEFTLDDTSLCSLKESNANKSQEMTNIENTSPIHAENSALISLLERPSKRALYTGLQLTHGQKQPQGLKSKIVADISKFKMSFSPKPKSLGKRKAESEAFSARELHDSPTEFDANTSIVESTKRQRKSKTSIGSASSNESINGKITKRAALPGQDEIDSRAIVPYNSQFSELQMRRLWPITPKIQNSIVNFGQPSPESVSMDNGSQVNLHSCEPHSLQDSKDAQLITLQKMTLTALKDMAKRYELKKYHKLRKAELVQLLVERMSNC
ncbi:hypothetical protein RIF29_39414 [Crotalaria pallida]|uniref:Rho termination factor N-terminal domain-containing protein n=1 Tax=Crotalaria pallida TaxID=3830 RepID=A0AAN9HMG6_CROPI